MAVMTGPSLNELSSGAAQKFDSRPPARFASHCGTQSRHGEWRHRAAEALRSLVQAALPQCCTLCSARSGSALLCAPCMNALPALPAACPVCAQPSPGGSLCGACLKRQPAFTATIAACRYAFPLDRLVQALKYERRLHVAEPLGDLLAAAVARAPAARTLPQALVAVPLTAARQCERGFNQAGEIARTVARRSGLPVVHGLARTGSAPPQATSSRSQRMRNVRGAFACSRRFDGLHVALVDDVMTSGATLDAAARALLRAGAARVDAWVVARALPPGGAG
jgi:ComF family protein